MYDFRSLSPLDFEGLVRDLLQAELNLRIESFGPGRDGGIDFRFAKAGETTVIQVKHYVDSPVNALIRAAAKENSKVGALNPSRYIVATSASLTPQAKDRLIAALPDAPITQEDVFGRADLNNLLGRHPAILRKHFKLWLASTEVLERILHSGVYNRTEAEISTIKALVPKFVHNESVPKAEAILQQKGALIIAGEPGVGKTTLARMLIWLHAEQDWLISVVDDLKEAMEVATEGKKRLIFFDDFLGQINLTNDQIRDVDQRFPVFLEKVQTNKDLRFILTTRDYLLNQAQIQSRRLASHQVSAAELLLNVGVYTRAIRAQIVFNHIYFSNLAAPERQALLSDHFYLKIIDHRNFSPRLIELLTSADYHSMDDQPIQQTVLRVLNNPAELWEKPYRAHFSPEARVLMLTLFFAGYAVNIDALLSSFKRFAKCAEVTVPEAESTLRFRHALKELDGSVFSIRGKEVSFSNPGIRDFMERVVLDDRLIGTVVDAAGNFKELDRAWLHYMLHRKTCSHHIEDKEAWARAFRRISASQTGSPLERARLAMEMCEELNLNSIAELALETIEALETQGIDPTEVTESRSVLERLSLSFLPEPLKKRAEEVIPDAIANMLARHGGILELDDIRSLGNQLEEYGVDAAIAAASGRKAMEGFISALDESLSNVGSTSELESFEGELKTTLEKYGIAYSASIMRNVDIRREYLEEKENLADDDRYTAVRHSEATDTTDDEIKSLFATLLEI
jgi:hypothetical protein